MFMRKGILLSVITALFASAGFAQPTNDERGPEVFIISRTIVGMKRVEATATRNGDQSAKRSVWVGGQIQSRVPVEVWK